MKSDMGKFILRLELGILLLFHGIHKILFGIAAIKGMVTAHHLPEWLAYGVFIGEVIGPLMIIVGFYTRIGAILIFINMLFALYLVHLAQFFTLANTGGWALELQGMYILTALVIALIGPGKYAVRN